MSVTEIADALERAPRQGSTVDTPEGSRYAAFSDTLLQQFTRELRMAAAERPDAEALGGQRDRR